MNQKKNNLIHALKIASNLSSAQNNPKKHLFLIELNNIMKKFEQSSDFDSLSKFNQQNIIIIIRVYLIDPKSITRLNAIAFFRHVLSIPQVTLLYKKFHIPIFVARSLQREMKEQKNGEVTKINHLYQQVLQSLKLIRKWIQVSADTFPKFLLNSLISFSEQPVDDPSKKVTIDQNLKRFAIESIRKLIGYNPKLCAWSGAIKLLIDTAIDPTFQDLSDGIVCTLLLLLNEAQNRQKIGAHLNLRKFFAVFTDIDYDFEGNSSKQQMKLVKNRFESQLSLAKKAIIIIIKSWTGLIYLGHQQVALKSLIEVLRQPVCNQVRTAIFQILQQLLNLGNFNINNKEQNFGVQGLLKCYVVILVQMLLNCNLFKILVELNGIENQQIVVPAKRILKQLTTIMFNSIPNSTKYTDFLITAACQNQNQLLFLKSCSSSIVNTMGNYIYENSTTEQTKIKKVGSKLMFSIQNLYLNSQLGVPCYRNNNQTLEQLRTLVISDTDENKFLTLVKSSNVLENKETSWKKWNWEDIYQIFQIYLQKSQRIDFLIKNKFLKRVLKFYNPSNRLFVNLNWHSENFIYIKVGYLLIKKLIIKSQGRVIFNQYQQSFQVKRSFLAQLNYIITEYMNGDKLAQQLLNPQAITSKLSRQLFSWIGIFSQSTSGIEMLKSNQIFDTIQKMIKSSENFDHLLSVLIYSLDYSFDNSPARIILEQCFMNGTNYIKASCLELMRILHKIQSAGFKKWALKMLQIAVSEQPYICIKALNIIEDIIVEGMVQNNNLIEDFFKQNPPIEQLSLSSSFILVATSNKHGFNYLNKNDWLQKHLQNWDANNSKEYCEKVEKCLKDALNFVSNEDSSCYTFRMPDIGNDYNNFLQMYFFYRIPWNLKITLNQERQYETIIFLPYIICQINLNELVLSGKPKFDKPVQMNENLRISIHLNISNIYLDNMCNDYLQPFKIKCLFQDKKLLGIIKDKKLIITKGTVSFIFYQQNNNFFFEQIQISMMMTDPSNIIKIPMHAFGEIVKTKKGVQILKKGGWMEKLSKSLNSDKLMDIRATLWTLGNIGMTKYGIQLIKQHKLLDKIIEMAQKAKCLSLRGSSIYIVNMLCRTVEGRLQIERNGWTVSWNSNLGWICIPKNPMTFLKIEQSNNKQDTHWAGQNEIWNSIDKLKSEFDFDPDERRFIKAVSLLSNSLTSKNASLQIMTLCKQKPEITKNRIMFYCVMILLNMYHFRQDARKFIFQRFDDLLKSPQILTILDQNSPQLLYEIC